MPGDPLRTGRLGDTRPLQVMEFLSSMEADRWIADADVLVDIAHLLMLITHMSIRVSASMK